jgi:uncharacterized protein YoxC
VINSLVEAVKTSSEQITDTINKLASSLASKLEETGKQFITEQEKMRSATKSVTSSLEDVDQRLKAIQMPEGIIEIKLQPFISGLTKAINNHAKATADQIAGLQNTVTQFDKSASALAGRMTDHSKATADQIAGLQKTVTEFDKTASELAGRMTEAERRRSEDQNAFRDLISTLVLGVAENGRTLTELEKKVSSTPPPSRPERTDVGWAGWFRGGSQ